MAQKARQPRDSGWLTFEAARYKEFIFDVFAVKPETKEMKVMEIIVGSDHAMDQKEKFCRENGIAFETVKDT